MDDNNNISEYMPHLVYALMKSGATPSAINNFRMHRYAASSRVKKLPCPHCFAVGKSGWLDVISDGSRARSLKCHLCTQEILLQRPN